MKIKMLVKHGRDAVQDSLMDALLTANKQFDVESWYISFEVDEWRTFLSLLWLAYAYASRKSDKVDIHERYIISLTDAEGLETRTEVRYDKENGCFRYAAIN